MNGPTTVVRADIRDPEAVLTHPEVTGFIDFTQPVGLLAVAVLHFVTDQEDPHMVVARWREAMAPGSYLMLSHITGEGTTRAEADQVIAIMCNGMADPPTLRGHAEVRHFFDGFELLDPDLVAVHRWRPEGNDPQTLRRTPDGADEPFWMYAGVGTTPPHDPRQRRTGRARRAR